MYGFIVSRSLSSVCKICICRWWKSELLVKVMLWFLYCLTVGKLSLWTKQKRLANSTLLSVWLWSTFEANHHTRSTHRHFRPKLFNAKQLKMFSRFSSTSRQVNRRCWGPRCRSRTHKTLTGDQDPLCHPPFPKPDFYFSSVLFPPFAEVCPKRWQKQGKITIIRITTTAPAGKTAKTAGRSHVWASCLSSWLDNNNNNNNWRN